MQLNHINTIKNQINEKETATLIRYQVDHKIDELFLILLEIYSFCLKIQYKNWLIKFN